ncbi:hypothetical protein ABZ468_23960 [Streptomyces sp. NPDC005708]|uniref:hypothetical protein n=1 Tax=Streptomyces sp. NPDC005708 TaxID=3154564 RepID=UPI0033C03C50
MRTRTLAVTAAAVSAAVLVTTGITYASTNESVEAAPSAKRAAPAAHKAVKRPSVQMAAPLEAVAAPATAPNGDSSGGNSGNSGNSGNTGNSGNYGNEDRGNGGGRNNGSDRDNGGNRDNGGDRGDRGGDHKRVGRIYFNEREYPAFSAGCIVAASGLGSTSFSVDNDSDKTVEVFRGFTCDNGGPVATVGPYGRTFGVVTNNNQDGGYGEGLSDGGFPFAGGAFLENATVGSFRVIDQGDW